MEKMIEVVFWVVVAGTVIWLLVREPKKDDTDPPGKGHSGLGLYTDFGTGCQYLQAGPLGGITPRLDAKGNHVCLSKAELKKLQEAKQY